jgi:hypothetical protein
MSLSPQCRTELPHVLVLILTLLILILIVKLRHVEGSSILLHDLSAIHYSSLHQSHFFWSYYKAYAFLPLSCL